VPKDEGLRSLARPKPFVNRSRRSATSSDMRRMSLRCSRGQAVDESQPTQKEDPNGLYCKGMLLWLSDRHQDDLRSPHPDPRLKHRRQGASCSRPRAPCAREAMLALLSSSSRPCSRHGRVAGRVDHGVPGTPDPCAGQYSISTNVATTIAEHVAVLSPRRSSRRRMRAPPPRKPGPPPRRSERAPDVVPRERAFRRRTVRCPGCLL
jgi:hypothetical protein